MKDLSWKLYNNIYIRLFSISSASNSKLCNFNLKTFDFYRSEIILIKFRNKIDCHFPIFQVSRSSGKYHIHFYSLYLATTDELRAPDRT